MAFTRMAWCGRYSDVTRPSLPARPVRPTCPKCMKAVSDPNVFVRRQIALCTERMQSMQGVQVYATLAKMARRLPVQEVDGAGGKAALHDVCDVRDVDAARSRVRAHHHAALPAATPILL